MTMMDLINGGANVKMIDLVNSCEVCEEIGGLHKNGCPEAFLHDVEMPDVQSEYYEDYPGQHVTGPEEEMF